MAKRGPKPKTARPKPANKPEVLTVPAHLTGVAREEYLRVAHQLRAAGTFDKHDSRLVETYAEAHALRLAAWARLEKDGMTCTTETGRPVAHPAVQIWREAATRQKIAGAALGLNDAPAPEADPVKGDDGWGDLLSFTG